jgi:DNA repair exonuclease SbcCD ATPase subunit
MGIYNGSSNPLRRRGSKMYEELIEQLRYMADTPSYTAFHDKTERTIICDKCKSPVCYEREIDAHWCMYQFLMNAANAIERIASEITTIQAENAEKDKEIGRLQERLQPSPYGDDKIDELEEACDNLRDRVKTEEQRFSSLQAENAEKNKEIERLKKAMIKADFTYYFGPDYVDEDTEE